MGNIIVIEREMLKSSAFHSLNRTAILVLLDFLMKRKMKTVKVAGGIKVRMILNNGQLQYTYKTALENGITRPAFSRAIDTLIAHGFLDIAKQGSGGKHRDPSLYSISERWHKWGTPQFDLGKPRVRDIRKGRGFSVMWKKKRIEEGEAIFGNASVTEMSNASVTPKSNFEGDFELSSIQNVTPKKAGKRRKGLPALN